MCDESDDQRRHNHQTEGEQTDLSHIEAKITPRSPHRRLEQQRRQKQRKNHLRREFDVVETGNKRQAKSADEQ